MSEKLCTICKHVKPLTEFNKNKGRQDGLQTHCRQCSKKKSRKYYHANREKHKQITIARKHQVIKECQQYTYDYLLFHSCVDCGENDPIVLEFDHVRGKKRNAICFMIGRGCSLTSIKKEIEKCEVRCANCHRRKTAKDFEWYRNIREHS